MKGMKKVEFHKTHEAAIARAEGLRVMGYAVTVAPHGREYVLTYRTRDMRGL
jgi:hypothetical protein